MKKFLSTLLFSSIILCIQNQAYSQGVMISNDPAPPAPSALLHTLGLGTGEGNVLFTGQYKSTSPGIVPASGSGTRLMWYPDKAVFRAGRVSGTQWNNENVGNYSAAFGFNSIASNTYAMAWGDNTTAAGPNSTAFGWNTNASGFYATAFGTGTVATSANETVIGRNNTEYTPLGSSNTWNSADRLFVIGNGASISERNDALVILKNGNMGLGTSNPTQRLEVAGSIYGQSSNWAIRGLKTGTTGTFPGVWGETESGSANANGIRGFANNTTSGSGSAGVFGKNFSTTNANYGVFGEAVSFSGRGVYGLASATSGENAGVYGYTASSDGFAAYFTGAAGSSNYFERKVGIGTFTPIALLDVLGSSSSTQTIIRARVSYSGQSPVTAITGISTPASGWGTGGKFEGGRYGVEAYVDGDNTTEDVYGVHSAVSGLSPGNWRFAGYFDVYASNSTNYGVYARAENGITNYGILASTGSGLVNNAGYFSGNVTVTGSFSNPSDAKLKQNINKMENALPKVIQLEGKVYENKIAEYSHMNLSEGKQFGFIAQDVENIFPELVRVNQHPGANKKEQEEGIFYDPVDYKSINYIGMIPVLVEAIKEQQEMIETLKAEIDELKKTQKLNLRK